MKKNINHIITRNLNTFSFVVFLLGYSLLAQVPPANTIGNFLVSTEYLTDNSTGSKIIDVHYYDALGRESQTVKVKGTPNEKDVVVKFEYGTYGRKLKSYLPVPNNNSNGAFLPIDNNNGIYQSYYQTNYNEPEYFYSEVELEAPPLNRVLKKASPGTDWSMGQGNEVEYKYEIAPTTPSTEAVVNYKANATWNETNKIYDISLQKLGNYGAGLLHKTTQTDENGHKTEQFVNRKGQTVLIRKFSTTGTGTAVTKHDTYYVYDSYGNLTYMLPPKLSAITTITTTHLNEMGYLYKYDKRNRLVEKKLPGKGLETFVYDKQDRLVATRDVLNPWMFVKYDKFGREVYSGTYSGSETRAALQNTVNSFGSNDEERVNTAFSQDGTSVYYTKTAFPVSNFSLLTVNYYDNYANILPSGLSVPSSVEGQTVISQVNSLNGVPVSSYTRILGTTKWEQSYSFYDNKLQPVRNYKVNYLGGYIYVDSKLDFRGKPEFTKTYHRLTSRGQEFVIQDNFEYDHQERLLNATNKIGSGNWERIASNTYDALGNLVSKQVGNTTTLAALQKVDYKYNIRGWMTDINDVQTLTQSGFPIDLFAFQIYYNTSDDDVSADLGIEGLYNGNISQTKWRTASDNILRGYAYEYDQLNRLRNAHYHKPGTTVPFPENYNESLTYDLNGNIMSLKRKSAESDTPTGAQLTDDLTYLYTTNSNKLVRVTDATNSTIGFSNGSSGTTNDYTYDLNGNMLLDRNKGITSIVYNHLSQPTSVVWSATKKIDYLYNAAGQKVQKIVTDGSSTTTTDYIDGFQYSNNFLEFFPISEGYVKATANSLATPDYSFNYVYNHTDHLGNIRISYTKDPQTGSLKVLDESHHYPFGLKHNKYNSLGLIWSPAGVIIAPVANNPFKYKFQAQELQDEHNLNWYSYRYRNYDPAIGRFFNVDPLSESFAYNGVYNFSENRVIDAFELEGLEAVLTKDQADDVYNADMSDYYSDGSAVVAFGGDLPMANVIGSKPSGRVENIDMPYRDNIVIPDNVDLGVIGDAIQARNGFLNGSHDFVENSINSGIDLYNDWDKEQYWQNTAIGLGESVINNPMFNNDIQLKAGIATSIANASAYDWGYFGGYQGTAFATTYAVTGGVGGMVGGLGRMSVTTSDGFLFGSVGFRTPINLRVGLYASQNTMKYGTFKWSTIAPKLLGNTKWFGRRMLQITPEFQSPLGPWSTQTIPKGTYIRMGLVGPQKGMGFGSWLQFYAPNGIPFKN